MDINVEKIQQLFKKNLVIPEYQRPYKWTEKNVKQLLDDIWESINASQLIYRIGTVIIHKENDELHIVDGQQRLVTITLVLNFLGDQTSPLLNGKFPNDISKSNIQKNYKAISEWLIDFNNEDKANFKNYLLKNCEFVKIELSDISEAFQLFDSQNARGKALEPYDLLKAFHLREMNTNTEIERMECVENWENAVNEGLLNNLGKYLFRIRKWSGDNPAYEFTKDDIDEFKGINIDEFKDYPYLKPYLLNDLVVKSMSKNPINHFFGADIYFPFQITQMIVNGKLFFEYVVFYADLYRKLFAKNDSDFSDFYENHCNYVGSHRTGDTYVREMFKGLILYYSDKFGETNFEEAYKLLYMWSYKLRLMKTRVQYNSIDKYIRENHNLFKEINSTYHPIEILKLKRKIQVLNEDCKYKIPEVMEVYKIINK